MGGEIFAGEAGKVASAGVPESVKSAFGAMRFIVTVGWSIYPLGYFFGYLCGAVAPAAQPHLQLGRLREQNRILLGHLARRQDGYPRQGVSDPRQRGCLQIFSCPASPQTTA